MKLCMEIMNNYLLLVVGLVCGIQNAPLGFKFFQLLIYHVIYLINKVGVVLTAFSIPPKSFLISEISLVFVSKIRRLISIIDHDVCVCYLGLLCVCMCDCLLMSVVSSNSSKRSLPSCTKFLKFFFICLNSSIAAISYLILLLGHSFIYIIIIHFGIFL